MRSLRILFTGGGSGGHVTPLVAVAQELQALAIQDQLMLEFYYAGPRDEFAKMLEQNSFRMIRVASGKIRRYFSILNILDIFKIIFGIFQSLCKLYLVMPDVVFSKGGTGAFSVILAAWFYRIPVIIHESDASPGLTNLVSARCARKIGVSFQGAIKFFNPQKTAWVGTPLRREFLEAPMEKTAAKEKLGFAQGEPLVVIIGGSQGAVQLNELTLAALPELLKITAVLQQTGRGNFEDVMRLSQPKVEGIPDEIEKKHPYKPVAFFEGDIATVYAAADVVISRSGSTSLAEIAAMAKPSILIPHHDGSNGHQRANAYEYAKVSGAIIIESENLLPNIFVQQIHMILSDENVRRKMEEGARAFHKANAAHAVAEEILKLGFRVASPPFEGGD